VVFRGEGARGVDYNKIVKLYIHVTTFVVRAGATRTGPPRVKTRLPHNLDFHSTTYKFNNKPPFRHITLILNMENPLWSSPPRDGEHGDWHTPPRKTVRVLAIQGKSDREIVAETGIPKW